MKNFISSTIGYNLRWAILVTIVFWVVEFFKPEPYKLLRFATWLLAMVFANAFVDMVWKDKPDQ